MKLVTSLLTKVSGEHWHRLQRAQLCNASPVARQLGNNTSQPADPQLTRFNPETIDATGGAACCPTISRNIITALTRPPGALFAEY